MIKKTIKRIIWGYKSSSEDYINKIKKGGGKVGEGTTIYNPNTTFIDITRPFLLDIGQNVQITNGVTILTHGYDWSVLKNKYGDVLGSAGKVKIGNNVFIGMQTTILKGVTIGDNVIIGANSLVNKDLASDGVYAGNPIRYICSLDEYYEKRCKMQYDEAYCIYLAKKNPQPEDFREFFWLFDNDLTSEGKLKNTEYHNVMKLGGEESTKLSYQKYLSMQKKYRSYDELIRSFKDKYEKGKL